MGISQTSFGSRLDNAKKVWVHTSAFKGFNPPAELSVASFGEFLDNLEKHNADIAGKADAYSHAIDIRKNSFTKAGDSLSKMAGQISAAVSAQYDVDSRQATDVKAILGKIRGKVKKTAKVPPTNQQQTATAETKTVSQRETGFGNKLKTFADLVATVKNFGTTYVPGNMALSVPALEKRLAALSDINKTVTVTYSALKQSRFERIDLYKKLASNIRRIKNAAKGQYGNNSVEYTMIKGIKN